jgi:hypothetical protein
MEAIQGCDANPNSGYVEGITSKVKQRLQCRKKPYPGQTDTERWKDIYMILFPNEEAPSPCKWISFNAWPWVRFMVSAPHGFN